MRGCCGWSPRCRRGVRASREIELRRRATNGRAPRFDHRRDHRPHLREQRRIGGLRRAAGERRRGLVLEQQLDLARLRFAHQRRDHRECEVDARRHAAAGDVLAVDHDPCRIGNRAELREHVARQPVARGALTDQQSRRAEHERTRAHRREQAHFRGLGAQEVEHRVVFHQRVDAGAAGHADHVELRAAGEVDCGLKQHPRVALHRFERLPDPVDARAGNARQDLERPGDVELGDARENDQADVEAGAVGRCVAHGGSRENAEPAYYSRSPAPCRNPR